MPAKSGMWDYPPPDQICLNKLNVPNYVRDCLLCKKRKKKSEVLKNQHSLVLF